jgi:hypothetical protein
VAWIGQPLRRPEDAALPTGRGRFSDDLCPAGVVHLVLDAPFGARHVDMPLTPARLWAMMPRP